MVCTSSFGKGWEGSGIRQERGGGATLSIFPDVNELFTTVKCGGGGALLKDGDCRASSLYELIFLLTYFCPRRVNYQAVRIATGTCWTVNEDPSLCVSTSTEFTTGDFLSRRKATGRSGWDCGLSSSLSRCAHPRPVSVRLYALYALTLWSCEWI